MKTSYQANTPTTAVKTALQTAYNVQAVPRLTIDWNWNKYVTPTADNVPSEDIRFFDNETFPIETIYDPIRPSSKGILKARVGQAVVADEYRTPQSPKFYIGDDEDVYKYWTSPDLTNGSGTFPNHSDGATTCRPTLFYSAPVSANKIVVRFDNTWASPNSYSIQIATTVGGVFATIAGASPTYDSALGVLTLYYNGTAWVTTKPATLVMTSVAAIRMQVNSLKGGTKRDGTPMTYKKRNTNGTFTTTTTTGASSSFNLISIEAHVEIDASSRLISVSHQADMSDVSEIYPIGQLLSGDASVVLANDDSIFSVDNTSGPYTGLLEPNAEFNLEIVYTIGGQSHSVQQFKMYANNWDEDAAGGTVTVSLTDYSKFLKTIKPRSIMYEGKPVTEIIWRLLDSIGFIDYEVQSDDLVAEHIIPVFYTNGDDYIWNVLEDLSVATQTAIYFDSYGKLQVRTRNAAFRDTATPDWTLLGQPGPGGLLPDIISLEKDGEYEANRVTVGYKTTKWKTGTSGLPAMSAVWTPDGTVALRSCPILRSMNATETGAVLVIDKAQAATWPFAGMVNIDSELIRFDAKQYCYWTGATGNVKNYAYVTSVADTTRYAAKTPAAYRSKNGLTGAFRVTERGVWNTAGAAHSVTPVGWSTYAAYGKTRHYKNRPSGLSHNRAKSIVILDSPPVLKNPETDYFWATRSIPASFGNTNFGTKMMFVRGAAQPHQRGGISIRTRGQENNGYYIELTPTSKLDAKRRKTTDEVTVYSRRLGKNYVIAKGQVNIAENLYYDVDVELFGGGSDKINVYINGTQVCSATAGGANKWDDYPAIDFFTRGQSRIQFEYIYQVNNPIVRAEQDFDFNDLKYGAQRGGAWMRLYMWQAYKPRIKLKKKKNPQVRAAKSGYYFDEFGAYAHEVREYDVKFTTAPVKYSYLYSTNSYTADVVQYSADPFHAKFVVANMGRNTAILNGEDSLTYGASNVVNQAMTVLGQDLIVGEQQSIIKENTPAIRKRGPIEAELTSDWIQSSAMATDIANWMIKHWAGGVDQLSVEVFGNPLFEISDVVAITYNDRHMNASTHKYFVTGIQQSFDTGLSTTLSLRRIR